MQEIAEEDDLLRAGSCDRAIQALHVLGGGSGGQRNAGATEARRLAEMEVGDEERQARRPEHRALRQQHQLLARHLAIDHEKSAPWIGSPSSGGAAVSNSSCMRRTRSASFSLVSFSRKRPTMIGNAKGDGLCVCRSSIGVEAIRRRASASRENSSCLSRTSRSACP